MKTGSSITVAAAFPYRLLGEMRLLSSKTGKSIPWHIRQACMIYLAANGVDVSGIENSEGRGARNDIKKLSREETSQLIEQLKKTRKLKKKKED